MMCNSNLLTPSLALNVKGPVGVRFGGVASSTTRSMKADAALTSNFERVNYRNGGPCYRATGWRKVRSETPCHVLIASPSRHFFI